MRDLDFRAHNMMKTIDSHADEYMRNQRTLTADQKKEQLDKIQGLFNKAKVCCSVTLTGVFVGCFVRYE